MAVSCAGDFCGSRKTHVRAEPTRVTVRGMRAREAGITIGTGTPGPLNSITDVPGVRVGHTTLIDVDGACAGDGDKGRRAAREHVERAGGKNPCPGFKRTA